MVTGQDVLSRTLDVAALNRVEARLASREAARGQGHAQTLRDVLDLHRIYRAAGWELSTVPQVALVQGCSESRAADLLADALTLAPLPGALEAVECGLLSVEQSHTLVRHLDVLSAEHRLGVWERLQARLLEDLQCASVLPPARLAELLRRWVIEADPSAAIQRRKDSEARRAVDYRRHDDGLTDLLLLGASGPQAQAALDNIRRHATPMSTDDERTADQRRLDAALDLLCGRSALPFTDGQHCAPGCDCRPGQGAPCGADVTVLVPLGAALGTTDELAELVGHGPLEPDLLNGLLLASPLLRAVFVDPDGIPVASSDLVERPPRDDPAALREALLRLAHSPPGAHQPRHPGDHDPPPDPPDHGRPDDPGGGSPPGGGSALIGGSPPDEPTPPPRPSSPRLGRVPVRVADRAAACAAAGRPVLLDRPHPVGTPGPYRPSARQRRFQRARRPRCEWPGCGARAARCDLDHDLPWPFGPTCPCNVGPLCRRHHRVKQNGWTKLRARDNTVRWTSPAGRTWTSPSPHQPPRPALRPLPAVPGPDPLDGLSSPEWEEALRQLDPASPLWHDPPAHELRAEDREPDDTDPFPADTRWTLDLDDPYAWHDLTPLDEDVLA